MQGNNKKQVLEKKACSEALQAESFPKHDAGSPNMYVLFYKKNKINKYY